MTYRSTIGIHSGQPWKLCDFSRQWRPDFPYHWCSETLPAFLRFSVSLFLSLSLASDDGLQIQLENSGKKGESAQYPPCFHFKWKNFWTAKFPAQYVFHECVIILANSILIYRLINIWFWDAWTRRECEEELSQVLHGHWSVVPNALTFFQLFTSIHLVGQLVKKRYWLDIWHHQPTSPAAVSSSLLDFILIFHKKTNCSD